MRQFHGGGGCSSVLLFFMAVFCLSPALFATENTEKTDETAESFHMQATAITQGHSTFNSPYSGKNSLLSSENAQTSETLTLFLGLNLASWGEFYIDPELTGGTGLSQTLGLAGYPNGEVYRIGDPTPVWNVARFYWKKVFDENLSSNSEETHREKLEDAPNQVARTYDVDRLTLVLGKFALSDFLDNNSFSHDSRTQFFNWALMDYGAWDYAADTKGYSWGLMIEWNQKDWALRFASVLEPAQANQLNLDMNVAHAHGDNLEFEYRYSFREQPGTWRALVFDNHADMGNYRTAINAASPPDVTTTRQYSEKYGFGLSLEQSLSSNLGVFSRLSWNNGTTETWTFTEIDQSVTAGVVWQPHWFTHQGHVLADALGAAMIVNDLSADHRAYLAAGGYGFIIGDGQLNYSSEKIAEFYYLLHLNQAGAVTLDTQLISCPAYNADRGPVSIFGIRLHYEI